MFWLARSTPTLIYKRTTYLEMPPSLVLVPIAVERIGNPDKFLDAHLHQPVVGYDRPATCRLATDDVTARGLRLVVSVDTVAEVDRSIGAERRYDLTCGGTAPIWQDRDEMRDDVIVL